MRANFMLRDDNLGLAELALLPNRVCISRGYRSEVAGMVRQSLHESFFAQHTRNGNQIT